MALTLCPECKKEVSSEASSCPSCGHPIKPQPQQRLWNPGLAAVLSFFIPGLGQIYRGQIAAGLILLIVTIIGYVAFIFPGVIVHVISIIMAASGDPYKK